MKILYVTPISPSNKTGGGRHCYANLKSILSIPNITIDYIGPKLDEEIQDISYDNFRFCKAREFQVYDKIKALLSFEATSLGTLVKEFFNQYSNEKYDLLFVENTRCGFLFSKKFSTIYKNSICVVHNVELDYLLFNRKWNFLLTRIFKSIIKRSEIDTYKNSDYLLFLHEIDKKRFEDLYNCNVTSKTYLHPVCSFTPNFDRVPFNEREKVILFMGSLDSKFNEVGLIRFLASCWSSNKGYTLKIAGRNPSQKLIEIIKKYKYVELFPNPNQREMADIIRTSRLLILPDITGTGMKLRVAEAMSYGLPIVGTTQGMYGYANLEEFSIIVDNIELMKEVIYTLINDEIFLEDLSKGAILNWEKYYAFEAFKNRIHNVINQCKLGT